jgi:hypothetical protein
MSLAVTVFVPGGIVMATDSRISATRHEKRQVDGQERLVEQHIVLSDSANKVLALNETPVGISTHGAALIQNQMVESHILAFEEAEVEEDEPVQSVADKLVDYFRRKFQGVEVGFHVAGYEFEDGQSVPYVFVRNTTRPDQDRRTNLNPEGQITYGATFSGDTHIVQRLIGNGAAPALSMMPLQDTVDFAIHLIRTTIDQLRFEPRHPSVGGPIDVLLITPSDIGFVQRKEIHGQQVPGS